MNELAERIRSAFSNLAPRERLLVASAAGMAAITLLYVAVVLPVRAAADGVTQRLETAEREFEVIVRLRREFDEVNGRLTSVEQKIRAGQRGNLRTTLESLARQSAVKVESMEPQAGASSDDYRENKVEVGLKSVTLAQTVNYLHRLETATQVLSVKTLRIRTRPEKPELLDVTFTVSSFEPI